MLDNIPIKKRLYGILALLCVAGAFTFAFSLQTFQIAAEVKGLQDKTKNIGQTGPEIIRKQALLQQMDKEIFNLRERISKVNTHADFIHYVESKSEESGVTLLSHPIQKIDTIEDYQFARIEFSLEGNFHDLLHFIFKMEFKDQVAAVEHLGFIKEEIRLDDRKRKILKAFLRVNRLLTQPQHQT